MSAARNGHRGGEQVTGVRRGLSEQRTLAVSLAAPLASSRMHSCDCVQKAAKGARSRAQVSITPRAMPLMIFFVDQGGTTGVNSLCPKGRGQAVWRCCVVPGTGSVPGRSPSDDLTPLEAGDKSQARRPRQW